MSIGSRTLISVRHNFETGHRLPHIPGKCQSLHGHSWWAEVWISAPGTDERGMVVEYGDFKRRLRDWIDEYWDHGLILGQEDPLCKTLADFPEMKVYALSDWPTVELVCHHLVGVANWILVDEPGLKLAPGAFVDRVRVQETHVNAAEWHYGQEW